MSNTLCKRFIDDESAVKFVKYNLNSDKLWDCLYYYYLPYFEEGGDIYFGFFADSKITKLAEEINLKFTNIKIILIETDIKLYLWNDDSKEYKYYIFRIKLNPDYSEQSNFVLNLAFAQFLRVACPEYTHYKSYYKSVCDNFIEGAINAFNRCSSVYGTWSFLTKFNEELFYKLDNIEIMNILNDDIEYDDMPRNSDLVNKIEKYLEANKNET